MSATRRGQPVLVGTISIEKSEVLSSILKRRGIKHEVLNAKYHEKEAEIVAQAGKKGAVTIATNMAGRGTDIVLGGNSEFLAKSEMRRMGISDEMIAESTGFGDTDNEEILEARRIFTELDKKYKDQIRDEANEVREAGGLYILGTERHESRRIDNQLRGRSGRQGDPGESRFFLSLEDDLLRLFGGDRIKALMNGLKIDEDMPIENKMLSNIIESSQQKVETRNFGIRKNVLQYDDVMNRQRELIYSQRDQVLDGADLKDSILKMLDETVDQAVDFYCSAELQPSEWNISGLREKFVGWLAPAEAFEKIESGDNTDRDSIKEELKKYGHDAYEEREKSFGSELMREIERMVLLRMVDTKWMDHIDAMEELKRGIGLRAYANHDPVVAYRIEGFEMFDEMINSIREDTVKLMLRVQIRRREDVKREEVAKPTSESGAGDGSEKGHTVRRTGKKVGRNDPCPCGSGKKYKKCCGMNE